MFVLQIASSNILNHRWHEIEPLITRALHYSDQKYSLDGIKQMLTQHEAVCWLALEQDVIKGLLIAKINFFECSKRLSLFMLAGENLPELLKFYPTIKQWAKKIGCNAVELFGRPGWEKTLAPYGFEKTHVVLRAML